MKKSFEKLKLKQKWKRLKRFVASFFYIDDIYFVSIEIWLKIFFFRNLKYRSMILWFSLYSMRTIHYRIVLLVGSDDIYGHMYHKVVAISIYFLKLLRIVILRKTSLTATLRTCWPANQCNIFTMLWKTRVLDSIIKN